MLTHCFDAGASRSGYVLLRTVAFKTGVQISCLRYEHTLFEHDGRGGSAAARDKLRALVSDGEKLRHDGEVVNGVVEGIEGAVYLGRSAPGLFDTATQAGAIGFALWMLDIETVPTTARAVRKYLFGNDRGEDNQVVAAVRGVVSGMPPFALPVPHSLRESYWPMHCYDAAAAGLWRIAHGFGWSHFPFGNATLAEIARWRMMADAGRSEKKLRRAAGLLEKKPRVETRGTRRRRSEAAKAAHARRV